MSKHKQQPIPKQKKAVAQPSLFAASEKQPRIKTVLHVGCGQKSKKDLPAFFHGDDWKEIRLDIAPAANPDIIADIMDMKPVADNSVDAVFSSHNIEHVYAYQVQQVLGEFYRVVAPGGMVIITCPDIQHVAFHVAMGRLDQPLYESPSGAITPQDILYGYNASLMRGEFFMAHKTSFTAETLGRRMAASGLRNLVVERDKSWNLWARGNKFLPDDPRMKDDRITIKGTHPFVITPMPELGKGLLPDDLDAPPKQWKALNINKK